MRRCSVWKIAPPLILALALAFLASCAPSKVQLPGPAPASVRFGVATDVHYADIEPRYPALVEVDVQGDITIKGFRKADSLRIGKEPS